MSGHSKWSTIKRKKGAADAKKGIAFTRLSKDITMAARELGGDPETNPSLRLFVKKAKAANMPVANIERAIKKGTGELPGVTYEDCVYEGYGPNGVAILIIILTDNKNRTLPEIRSLMTKNGGNLGESGCVNWMFEKKGLLTVSKKFISDDDVLEILELDVEDINNDDSSYEIIMKPENFENISKFLENKNITVDGEVTLVPKNTVKVSDEVAEKIINLINILEEHEDVQNVYSNFEVE
tara:strand:- start:648 stop:1364 length:717 start_codon:yes stop_codon:yes gene_type:complete